MTAYALSKTEFATICWLGYDIWTRCKTRNEHWRKAEQLEALLRYLEVDLHWHSPIMMMIKADTTYADLVGNDLSTWANEHRYQDYDPHDDLLEPITMTPPWGMI